MPVDDRINVIRGTLDPASDPEGYARIRKRGPSVLTIGKFDGIHRGHGALLRATVQQARRLGAQSGAVTFDVHPREVLQGVRHQYLTSLEERLELLADAGIDFVHVLRATPELFASDADDFATTLAAALNAELIVVGANFRFGRCAAGDIRTLARLGIPAIAVELDGGAAGAVSSSRIREELHAGRVECAAELLGRPYAVGGVIAAEEREHWLVAVTPELALPAPGAYSGRAQFARRAATPDRPTDLLVAPLINGRRASLIRVQRDDDAQVSAERDGAVRIVFESAASRSTKWSRCTAATDQIESAQA
jgi:riboflavin kinase/FMN adenylyltransferase